MRNMQQMTGLVCGMDCIDHASGELVAHVGQPIKGKTLEHMRRLFIAGGRNPIDYIIGGLSAWLAYCEREYSSMPE